MKRSIPGPLAALLLLACIAAGRPGAATGQEPQVGAEKATSSPLVACAARWEGDPFLDEVARARELDTPEAVKAALDALEPEARRMAAESPHDADAQYRLAAVMGARLDFEHGRMKMSGAEQLRDQAQRVLELDPNHGGASYMLGRLHASVLRMSGFKRFMAKQLFGGGALEGASWDSAQDLLELAVREDPCVPEHHFELARVYAQRGNDAGAEQQLKSVRELTEGRDGRQARLRQRADELEKEWRLGSKKL